MAAKISMIEPRRPQKLAAKSWLPQSVADARPQTAVLLGLLLSLALPMGHSRTIAQPPDDVTPGSVLLDNGLILRGLCTSGATLSGDPRPVASLSLKKIDQSFRAYYVANRMSGPIVPDNAAIPAADFRIMQKFDGRKPLVYAIGLHEKNPFQPDGRSFVELTFAEGRTLKIDVGIVGLNSLSAQVRGLTHDWVYGVSLASIPDGTLYSGLGQPGVITHVKGFDDGETQLNLAQMLMQADKFDASRRLLDDIALQFPDLKKRCERSIEIWNDKAGDKIVAELQRMKTVGKHSTAARYAREWPDPKLDPVVRVRARQFIQQMDEENRRLQIVSMSLDKLLGDVDDKARRRDATQMCTELKRELDANSLPRLAAYELVWQDEGLSAEAKIALAATGWLLGADNAIDEFADAFGLFQIRFHLADYMKTADSESRARDDLREKMQQAEGYSVQRMAMLLRHLPSDGSIKPQAGAWDDARLYATEGSDTETGCLGQIPSEYADTREYPLLIAIPYGSSGLKATLQLWKDYANRHGYVLAVPDLLPPTAPGYAATATQHAQMLGLIRRLKQGLSIDSDRVFIAGHGVGADAAMDIATAHPDLFAGVIPISGLGRKHLLWTIQNSSNLPWYVIVGTRQPHYPTRMIPLLNRMLSRIHARGRLEYCNAMVVSYPERGVESYAEEFPQLFEWMAVQKRSAPSDWIDATTVRSTDLSWGWIGMDSIEPRFTSLDEPLSPDDRPESEGHVQAEINQKANAIRIRSLPGNGFVRLSPDIPELDLAKTVVVIRSGNRPQQIDYQPSLLDLLEDFRERRDRSRFYFMKVAIGG